MSQTQRLISDHINIWTSAEAEKKSGRGRSSNNAGNIFGIQKMRELILELAVQGRLTSNNLNEKPSIEEPMEIQKEIPFKLHKNWRWTSLPNIAKYKVGKTPSTKNSSYWTGSNNGYNWVSIADLIHGETISKTSKKVTDLAQKEVFKSIPIEAGTILMSFKLTIGKISILEVPAYHNEAIISIYPSKFVNKDFLFKILPSRAKAGISKSAIKGNTLNSKSLAKLLIPLPPLPEQLRIVSKVNELMVVCDQLEQKYINSNQIHKKLLKVLLDSLAKYTDANKFKDTYQLIYTHFDTLFSTEESVSNLKKTLLDLAIMGKLTPQDHKEEPASELIKKIQNRKNKFINERKIKKEKLSKYITENEKLFKLPKGWEWTRLNNFSEIKGGKRLPAGETFSTKKTPYIYIQVTNMKNDEIVDENLKYISLETYNKINQYTISSEDLYITLAGTIGDVGSVPDRFNGMNLTENAAKIVFHDVNKEWLIYSLKSSWSKNQFLDKSVKVAQPKLGLHKISTLIIALPPLKEQQRIVSNLKELMSLCDVLQSHIQQASMQQKQIADVLVSQALN